MLRQAPNIILVGEIRDRETAEIAVQAALTGHLVFSTLHTNDAPSAITRLIDMGVKPFLASAAIQAVMAQRLLRVLCPKCKEGYTPDTTELRTLGIDASQLGDRQLYRAAGCDACEQTGYRGRLGIFELMILDNPLREMIFRGESTLRLREYARTSAGMRTLTDDGVRKVLAGTTSVDELLRVTAAWTMENRWRRRRCARHAKKPRWRWSWPDNSTLILIPTGTHASIIFPRYLWRRPPVPPQPPPTPGKSEYLLRTPCPKPWLSTMGRYWTIISS